MTENKNDEKTFKVQDRRTSSGSKEDAAEAPGPGDSKEAGRAEAAGGSGQKASGAGPGGSVPQVDFSTFIFSLFSSALIQLGDMADPTTGKMEKNLLAAKQTIDILDILAQKTEGNLSDEEARLLKNASAELKWKYIDTVKEKG